MRLRLIAFALVAALSMFAVQNLAWADVKDVDPPGHQKEEVGKKHDSGPKD